MQSNLIRPKESAKRAGISISHMYELIKRGDFPKTISISPNISAHVESEVDAWITDKIKSAKKAQEAANG